ncbi:hypothetical protein KFK09_016360 [Dendrobium nobile]|uniref:Uncharacterized protein n=1 Tax=Dendrobium nobile TaxID=94219 RepID=A0A8T3B4J2_DENNO|nr:hypothetical protein KFK09_016360 [Dendrobium nobile]
MAGFSINPVAKQPLQIKMILYQQEQRHDKKTRNSISIPSTSGNCLAMKWKLPVAKERNEIKDVIEER